MAVKLWDVFDGEPFLDNPYLTVFSNPKGEKKMAKHRARNAKGRFVKTHRSNPRGKAKARRIVRMRRGGVALINPRRKRSHRINPPKRRYMARVRRGTRAVIINPRRHRRGYRPNPVTSSFTGLFSAPMLKTIGLTAGGFVAVPFIEGFVAKFIPASMQGKLTSYAVKIASVIGLSMLVGKFMGKEAGQKVAIGGGAYVAVVAVKDFFPTLLPASAAGAGSYLRAQPMLGAYQRSYMGSAVTQNAPGRLQPQSRY